MKPFPPPTSGFKALGAALESPTPASSIPAVDTDQLMFLRAAMNTPSLKEVDELIRKTIVEFNMLNKIELTRDGNTVVLKDEPRHYLFPEIMTAVNAAIPAALIGPAGSGKSTACEQVAEALGLNYYLQNSVSGDHQLAGYMDAHGRYQTTTFRKCFEEGGLILIDEVDTSDAGALKWINSALANGWAMFPDKAEPVKRHEDFRILIAANTFGNGADRMYVGANQLDASTLDRFVFFEFNYDEKLEVMLAGDESWVKRVQALRRGALKEKARIVISPRASITGAKLLKKGWKRDIVENRVIWKGIDSELKARILKAA